jgi:tetratricopeptide (TPR) repeat protein
MSPDKKTIGTRLRAEREARRWGRGKMAVLMRTTARRLGIVLPEVESVATSIKLHEWGKHAPGADYRTVYAHVFGKSEDELFGAPRQAPATQVAPLALPNGTGDYAATVRDTNRQLIVLDSRYGGTAIANLAVHAFQAARSALATGRHDAQERDLQAATGETGEIAAWTLYDADQLQQSRATTHEAMFISRLAGDRAMELFELSHLALINLHERQSREALRIVEHTIEPGGLAPRVEALFKLRAARALAQGGDRARALATLDQASSALQESLHPRDPHWTWWLDTSELAWHRGILHMELGDLRTAMPYLDEAAHGRLNRDPYAPTVQAGSVTARGEEWGRAAYNDLVHLLLALTMAGAWQETEAIAVTVGDFTREVVSARTEVMLRAAVRKVMRAQYDSDGPSSTLSDLAEQIAQARRWPLS